MLVCKRMFNHPAVVKNEKNKEILQYLKKLEQIMMGQNKLSLAKLFKQFLNNYQDDTISENIEKIYTIFVIKKFGNIFKTYREG